MGKLSAENALRLVTHNVIPRPYLVAVVERALTPRTAGSGAHRRLCRLLSRHVEIAGYDDPWDAPAEERLQATVGAVEASAPLWRAVLRAWARSQATLGALVETHLEERYGSDGAPAGGWTPDALRAAVDAIRGSVPGLAHNDVALMLCWLTGYVPLPDDEPPPTGDEPPPTAPAQQADPAAAEDSAPAEPLPVRWQGSAAHWQALFLEVLESLRRMAADSPVWEAVRHFAESLRQLVEEKAAERQQTHGRLQDALAALRQEAAADPGYFAFTDLPHWRAEDAPLHRVPDLVDTAEALRQHLRRHRRLRGVVPASMNEGLVQRMRLQTLESAALEAHARLAETLGSGRASEHDAAPTPQAPPEAPPATPRPTPHEETPPGVKAVLDIVEEEAPAEQRAVAPRPDVDHPPNGTAADEHPEADAAGAADATEPPSANQAPTDDSTAGEPPPETPPEAADDGEPPDVPMPEAPIVLPELPAIPPEQDGDTPPAPKVPVEPIPEPPAVERPPTSQKADEVEAPEVSAGQPEELPADDVEPPTAPPALPDEGEVEPPALPSVRSASAAARPPADEEVRGSWFSDLAHWEPLARDTRDRRRADGILHPQGGLQRILRQARRFFARLISGAVRP